MSRDNPRLHLQIGRAIEKMKCRNLSQTAVYFTFKFNMSLGTSADGPKGFWSSYITKEFVQKHLAP